MAITLDDYLRTQGFSEHPFATTNAEREVAQLPAFFVRAPWFDWLVGDPTAPDSVILFAPQGYGKTSHRLELARRVSERHEQPVLVVTLNDFAPLIAPAHQNLLDTYISIVRRLTLEALDTALQQSPQRCRQFEQHPEARTLLIALLKLYAPRRCVGRQFTPAEVSLAEAFRSETLGPREWLLELVKLSRWANYACVYCLVDGVDELYETRHDLDTIFRLLGPLLDAPGLLQGCGFGFKFFLPKDVETEMKARGVGRLDRIQHRLLVWKHDQLRTMLSRRLVTFRQRGTSTLTQVQTFQDLCVQNLGFDVDGYLVEGAQGSPRRLIDLARRVLEDHCERVHSATEPIDEASLVAAVQSFTPDTLAVRPKLVASVNQPTVAELFIDDCGDIWLGERRIESKKLPRLPRLCIDYLWQQRGKRVSTDDLIRVLYGDDTVQRADPPGSLAKIIQDLRKILEQDLPPQTYIQSQRGYGYVLRNYRGAPQEPG